MPYLRSNSAAVPVERSLGRDPVALVATRESVWRERARCTKMADWGEADTEDKKEVCQGCPVIVECLAWAVASEPRCSNDEVIRWEVYGGLDGKQRQEIIRARRVLALRRRRHDSQGTEHTEIAVREAEAELRLIEGQHEHLERSA